MDKQARWAKEQMKALPFKEKMKNFWFYYKWHTFAGIAVFAMLAVTAWQVSQRVDYDINVACYTTSFIDDAKVEAFSDMLENYIDDVNENESRDVGITVNVANINGETMDQMAQAIMAKFSAELAAGTNAAFLADEAYKDLLYKYEGVVQNDVEISGIPEVRETLGLADGQKFYWVTMAVTEALDDDDNFLMQHKNAELIEDFFNKQIEK